MHMDETEDTTRLFLCTVYHPRKDVVIGGISLVYILLFSLPSSPLVVVSIALDHPGKSYFNSRSAASSSSSSFVSLSLSPSLYASRVHDSSIVAPLPLVMTSRRARSPFSASINLYLRSALRDPRVFGAELPRRLHGALLRDRCHPISAFPSSLSSSLSSSL